KFGYVGVVGTITGSPAAKANFTTGDMIESIGGVATRDMPLAYASMLLRGESGTVVELSVVRTRHPEPTAVKLTRSVFVLPVVESRMLASLFLNKGRITYMLGQKVPRQNFEADPAKAITMLPVAVLTNRGTADAAE